MHLFHLHTARVIINRVDSDCNQKTTPSSHPLWPSCTTLSSGPHRFRIHLMPCCCGSIMSGQRSLVVRMAAFSVDILSFGRPWLCQAATVASSVSMRTGSRPSVMGMRTWNTHKEMMSLHFELCWMYSIERQVQMHRCHIHVCRNRCNVFSNSDAVVK